VPSLIVLIGVGDSLMALRERLAPNVAVQTFGESDVLEAIEYIVRSKPTVVVLEERFGASTRGAALIERITDDPDLSGCGVRVIAPDGTLRNTVDESAAAGRAGAGLDPVGTRRAPRIAIQDGVEVLLDGNSATLVMLSPIGAMVASPTTLKPNQRVLVTFADHAATIRCSGWIVWARFEMPRDAPPRYSAGVELKSGDRDAISDYIERHRKH
jgi:hypothetical protein